MPVSTHRRSETPDPRSVSDRPDPFRVVSDRLQRIAPILLEAAEADPGPPDLIGLVDVEGAARLAEPRLTSSPIDPADTLVVVALTDPDPVVQLLGFTAPPQWWAVGVVTGARARPLDDPTAPTVWGTLVHLIERGGTSVSLLGRPGHEPLALGGDTAAVEGRLGDACRRMLGLSTAPPPSDMTAHVIDLWLDVVARDGCDHPGLDWDAVVARHPAGPVPGAGSVCPTPALMARHTVAFGAMLDWERYRGTCVRLGRSPFGDVDGDVAAWMDTGMFARWMLGEALPWPERMELLDGLLSPGAADRLWATLALCPRPPWPPSGASTVSPIPPRRAGTVFHGARASSTSRSGAPRSARDLADLRRLWLVLRRPRTPPSPRAATR